MSSDAARRPMRRLARRLGTVAVALILLWGALALLARLGTPLLEHARAPIADWLGQRLGVPVRFARLEASWWGLAPRLDLHEVRLGPEDSAVRLRRLRLALDHGGLLRGRPAEAVRLIIEGLRLRLIRHPDGRLQVEGLPTGDGGAPLLALPRHLGLRDARVVWDDRLQGVALPIERLDLDLERDGRRLHLAGRLHGDFGELHLVAELDGHPTGERWNGTTWIEARALRLPTLFDAYLPAGYRLRDGRLDLTVWQEWRAARLASARGRFRLEALDLGHGPGEGESARRLRLAAFGGRFDFRHRQDGAWRLLGDALSLRLEPGQADFPLRLAFAGDPEGGVELAITRLPLALLPRLLAFRPPPGLPAEDLAAQRAEGELRGVRARLRADGDWAVSGAVRGLSIDATAQRPGIHGLDLRFAARPGLAEIALRAEAARLDARPLFRAPHPLRRLEGRLWLTRATGVWTLRGRLPRIETPDFTGRARLRLDLPDEGPARLALRAAIENAPVVATGRHLPVGIMDEDLIHWLDTALRDGRVRRADLLLAGPLRDFPFETRRSGVFEVDARVEAARLRYHPEWPELRALDARLRFRQDRMDIEAASARLLDSRLGPTRVSMERLSEVSPLRVRGTVEGPGGDLLRVLASPPLAPRFGRLAQALRLDGDTRLDLELDLPLDAGTPRIAGHLNLDGNRLRLPAHDLTLEELAGTLRFDPDGLHAQDLRARLDGVPLRIEVIPEDEGTRILARGEWSVAALRRRLPALPEGLAEGRARFEIETRFARADTAARLSIRSDLAGLRIDLPPPLGKRAGQARALRIDLALDDPAAAVHLRYGKALDARFARDGSRGEIRHARGPARLPGEPGWRLLATVPRIEAARWQALAERLPGGAGSSAWSLDLRTDRLAIGALDLPEVRLRADGKGSTLRTAHIESPRLAGELHYRPGQPGLLTAALDRLHLTFDSETAEPGPVPDPRGGPDPRALPRLIAHTADLRLNAARLGAARLELEPDAKGVRITRLHIDGGGHRVQATGDWRRRAGRSESRLAGRLESDDLGALLAGLGYPRQVEQARARIRFDLSWPGHPLQLHRATLRGEAEIDIRDGRLAEVDPGIARVLGLLSIDALSRRLRLDFGDVLKKGYSFDVIHGSFTLGDGEARTTDLVVDGPSGRIEIGGALDLVRRRFDQVVQVTPRLDATLTIAGTLAGGPVAGLAALVAQRLLSDEIDQINRFEYSVTGGWDDPEIVPLDSGGPLSKLLHTLGGKDTREKSAAQEQAIDETRTRPRRNLVERLLGTGRTPDEADAKATPPETH